jgi:hypothetical protein
MKGRKNLSPSDLREIEKAGVSGLLPSRIREGLLAAGKSGRYGLAHRSYPVQSLVAPAKLAFYLGRGSLIIS